MSRLVTLPVGPRVAKRVNDPKVYKTPAADELRGRPCACCVERPGVTLHHVVPRSQRGDDVIENLVGLCVACHDALHHAMETRSLYLRIGRNLTPANIAYVLEKKNGHWLEQRYGVTA